MPPDYVGSPMYDDGVFRLREAEALCISELLIGDIMKNGIWYRVRVPRKHFVWSQMVVQTFSNSNAFSPWQDIPITYSSMHNRGNSYSCMYLPSSVDGATVHGWMLKGSGVRMGDTPGTWERYFMLEAWSEYSYNLAGCRKKRLST